MLCSRPGNKKAGEVFSSAMIVQTLSSGCSNIRSAYTLLLTRERPAYLGKGNEPVDNDDDKDRGGQSDRGPVTVS
jgi:hypothetical protein